MCMHYLAYIVSSEVSAYLDKIIESVSLRSIQVHQITSEPKRYRRYDLFVLVATKKIAFSDDLFFFSTWKIYLEKLPYCEKRRKTESDLLGSQTGTLEKSIMQIPLILIPRNVKWLIWDNCEFLWYWNIIKFTE